MTPIEIIRTATVNADELLGWQPRIGAIETNKLTDLIAIDGDPTKGITELEKMKFVMKGGAMIENEFVRK